jgi:hypothetical protein
VGKGRFQDFGVRSQNEEHLLSADCPLPFEGPQVSRRAGRDGTCATPALCLLLTAWRLLHLREAGWRRVLAGMAALDKMSSLTGREKTSNFKK